MSLTKRIGTALIGAIAVAGVTAGPALSQDLPGEGKRAHMARATWDTGWFQTAIYKRAMEELGYQVGTVTTLDNPAFYQAVGLGDVDFWVNGWFPLHDTYRDNFEPGATTIGYVAKGGALQGYLVDKKSAEKFDIKTLDDFRRDEVREAFDHDGDGMVEMVACPPGWGCEEQISKHLDKFDLRDVIEPIKASYAASMAEAVSRYRQGESILFYTWTPNWTVGILEPGTDVLWIQTPSAEPDEIVEGLEGCVADPCELGWIANDIRPVANVEFLDENPAVKSLLTEMRVPLEAIFGQNARMEQGEDDPDDLERHVDEWIADNQEQFDTWIENAKKAAM